MYKPTIIAGEGCNWNILISPAEAEELKICFLSLHLIQTL
jgi:hypothetical protein